MRKLKAKVNLTYAFYANKYAVGIKATHNLYITNVYLFISKVFEHAGT